jgi:hypothetical protein
MERKSEVINKTVPLNLRDFNYLQKGKMNRKFALYMMDSKRPE